MKFDFLFDPARHLFSIGYRVADGTSRPQLLRLARFRGPPCELCCDCQGRRAGARTGFAWARGLTPVDRGSALISWSGSMFEYLMPSLVMRAPAGSLLEQTNRLVVRRQIKYGAQLGVPWGISESAYNARDLELTYQYSNFGVPGLGLKRGLERERGDRALCDGAGGDGGCGSRGAKFLAPALPPAASAASAGMRRWTIRRRAFPRARPSRSCAPTWRIIKG